MSLSFSFFLHFLLFLLVLSLPHPQHPHFKSLFRIAYLVVCESSNVGVMVAWHHLCLYFPHARLSPKLGPYYLCQHHRVGPSILTIILVVLCVCVFVLFATSALALPSQPRHPSHRPSPPSPSTSPSFFMQPVRPRMGSIGWDQAT